MNLLTVFLLTLVIALLILIVKVGEAIGESFSLLPFLSTFFRKGYWKNIALDAEKQAYNLNKFQIDLPILKIYVKRPLPGLGRSHNRDFLRILSWNIERGFQPDALSAYINEITPDIVCLQEVDWGNERTNKLDVLDYLARETSMEGLFGIEFHEIKTPFRGPRLAGGGVHGNAILTSIRPSRTFRIELPQIYEWENLAADNNRYALLEGRVGGRFALCSEYNIQGRDYLICSTHLEDKDGGVEGRLSQIEHLMGEIASKIKKDTVSVIAGDMNTSDNLLSRLAGRNKASQSPDKPWLISECEWWKKEFLPRTMYFDPFDCKAWTYKLLYAYREKLDWILVSSNCEIFNCGLGGFNTSDHRPLWVDIRINSP